MEDVLTFLKQTKIENESSIVVGVSGGVDSMVLLSILKKYLNSSKCQVVCVHIHHNIRVESDQELVLVKQFCEQNNITFETTKLQYEKKFSEKLGREKRYQFFEQILRKYHSSYLFTAHHGDDLIETIFMKMTRGTSLWGASGIELISPRSFYSIVRPLLFVTKEDLYEYAKTNQIPFCEDQSNQDLKYTRNRYRQNLLPFLKKENPNVHRRFLDYSIELQEVLRLKNHLVDEKYQLLVSQGKLNWIRWKLEDEFIRKEILKKYLFELYGENIENITKKHLHILDEFLRNGEVHSSIDFPNHYEFIKEYDFLMVQKKQEKMKYAIPFLEEVNIPNGRRIKKIEDTSENSNFVTYLDSSMIALPLIVRNVEPGDKIQIKNMQGHKKIGNIFTDEKVKKEDRDLWPVVCDSKGTIIWLPGLKKTQFDRKKTGIYDIILKYY